MHFNVLVNSDPCLTTDHFLTIADDLLNTDHYLTSDYNQNLMKICCFVDFYTVLDPFSLMWPPPHIRPSPFVPVAFSGTPLSNPLNLIILRCLILELDDATYKRMDRAHSADNSTFFHIFYVKCTINKEVVG